MMIAWRFATALAKQWDAAIRKAAESCRITDEQKSYFCTLRVK